MTENIMEGYERIQGQGEFKIKRCDGYMKNSWEKVIISIKTAVIF